MPFKAVRTFATLALLAVGAHAAATPITVGGVNYVRSGNSELGINATFGGGAVNTAPLANTSTSLTYSGLVEFVVRGTGQSLGARFNDAFYVFTGGPVVNDPNYYQLAIDTATIQGSPGSPTPGNQLARQLIVFDVDAGIETTPAYVPTYQASHVYNFVIDVTRTAAWGGAASALNFTVANGIYADNSGAFNIDVYQLAQAAVPAPGTLALLLGGVIATALVRRRLSA